MNILHISESDSHGGADRAAYRLHSALRENGVESLMLVQRKGTDDPYVQGPRTLMEKVGCSIRPQLSTLPTRRFKEMTGDFYDSKIRWTSIVQQVNDLQPDVVHLHWVQRGMLHPGQLSKIKAPLVWTLHDMWPLTGGCHYDDACGKFTDACGECPVLNSKGKHDLSLRQHQLKRNAYTQAKPIHFVCISHWLKQCVETSAVTSGHPAYLIPNPLNTTRFKPLDQANARKLFSLPEKVPLILFGALHADREPRKGFDLLLDAIHELSIEHVELVVFGCREPSPKPNFGKPVHYLGRLADDVSLAAAYNAADVMVVPSRQEAFGQTASEAMACGTPVVSFDVGGLKDIIDHEINGYKATPFDVNDLSHGLRFILEHPDKPRLDRDAREKALRQFENSVVAQQFRSLYQTVCG